MKVEVQKRPRRKTSVFYETRLKRTTSYIEKTSTACDCDCTLKP